MALWRIPVNALKLGTHYRVHGREHGCQKVTPVFTGRVGHQCIHTAVNTGVILLSNTDIILDTHVHGTAREHGL